MSINKSLQQHRKVRNAVINLYILIAVFSLYYGSLSLIIMDIIMLNAYGWLAVATDKKRAQTRQAFRYPESTFLFVSLCGGAWATLLVMQVYRHKTQHRALSVGILLLAICNTVLFYYGYIQLTSGMFTK